MIYAERLINHLRKEKGEGKDKMQENRGAGSREGR